VLNFLLHARLGIWSVPLPHYFLQFSGKVIALGKPQPMLLGYEQIIPTTIGEAKSSIITPRLVYGENAFCFKENLVLKPF